MKKIAESEMNCVLLMTFENFNKCNVTLADYCKFIRDKYAFLCLDRFEELLMGMCVMDY